MKRPLLERWRLVRALTDGDWVIAAMALAICVYYASTRGVFQGKASGDGFFGFMYLPSIVFNHTLDLAKAAPFWAPILGHEKTGHVANACPIGPVIFWFPSYLVAIGVEKLAGWVLHWPAEKLPGQTVFDFWMAGLGSLAAGLAGIALMYRFLKRLFGLGAARFGTVAATLATPLVWYLVTQPLYQHACAFFMVTLFVERWHAWRGAMSLRRFALLGAIGGGAMLMRFQEGMWLLLPGLDAAGRALSALRGRRWREMALPLLGGLLMGVTALCAFSPQLATWKYFFGFLRPPQPPGHMRWSDPALVATLFSTRGGMLPWTPILYLVVPGLLMARRRAGALRWRLGLMLAVEVWVNASAWDHWGSWTFGPRRFTDATVVFGFALAGLWAWVSERGEKARRFARRATLAVAVLAVLYNGLLMELVRQGKMKSSGARAAPASTWIAWAKGPKWLGRVLDVTGYPFCQPAGWIYSLIYRVPPGTFEGVVGGYIVERDCRIHGVATNTSIAFTDPLQHVPEGIIGPAVGKGAERAVPVARRVRLLIPLFTAETLRAKLSGAFHGQEHTVAASWNGTSLVPQARKGLITWEVPAAIVHTRAWTNELVFDLPEGTLLQRIDFESTANWWDAK
ncbi:MAG: hypothetical protein EXR72_12110 [Myxococcales bacterium]|nr:hypothetical protein [Myxococcales bacterium]